MQPAPNLEQSSAAQVLTKLVSLVSTWEDLFAEDAVFESPFASGTPRRLEGKEAVCNFLKDSLA